MFRLLQRAGITVLCLLSSICFGDDYGFYQPSGTNKLVTTSVANIGYFMSGNLLSSFHVSTETNAPQPYSYFVRLCLMNSSPAGKLLI
jgi:hypothetical protein